MPDERCGRCDRLPDVGSQRVGNRRRGASAVVVRVISLNVAQRIQLVTELLDMDTDAAPLQEVGAGTLGNSVAMSALSPRDPWA